MQIYKIFIYSSLFLGFVGLFLLFLKKIDESMPKYLTFMGKCFITLGFYLLLFSLLTKDVFNENEDLFWIFFGICSILFTMFFYVKSYK